MKKVLLVLTSFILTFSWSQEWQEIEKIVASDRKTDDQFGYAVDMDGNYAIIGAWLEDEDENGNNPMSQSGAAYIFKKDNTGSWVQMQKIVASDRSSNDEFGTSVGISGNYIVVGAPENVAGAAYVFELNGNTWSEVIKLEASDGDNNDLFGFSVAIDGNAIIVGAYKEEEDQFGNNTLDESGSAYIFERINATWSEVDKIVASDRANDDWFGYAVDIADNYAIVGVHREDEDSSGNNFQDQSGSVYVFERIMGGWVESQKLVAQDRSEDDEFGYAVAMDDTAIIVGAYLEEEDANGQNNLSSAGSVYVFENNSGVWEQSQKIVPSDRTLGDLFGCAVDIYDDLVVIGAYKEDQDNNGLNTLNNSGSAYVFRKENNGFWSEVEKLSASDREAQDNFGIAVAITQGYILVGVPLEDEDEMGNNSLIDSGSTYIYENSSVLHIDQSIAVKSISLFPNPTDHSFRIKTDKNIARILVFDLSGKIVNTYTDTNFVDVRALEKGLYMVEVEVDNEIYKTKLLVY